MKRASPPSLACNTLSAASYACRKSAPGSRYTLRTAFAAMLQLIDSTTDDSGMKPAWTKHAVHAVTVPNPKGNAMKALLIALLGMSVLSLTACNTVEGAGKDVKAGGQAIENTAKDAKPK